MIKPIQTRYKGYHFRSRLEARWAVFFDALGVQWEYEPEGFELPDGTRYLPDFWLPKEQLWVEIKGREPTRDEQVKCHQMALGSGNCVALIYGSPGSTWDERLGYEITSHKALLFSGWAPAPVENSYYANWAASSCFEPDYGLASCLERAGMWDEGHMGHGSTDEERKALALVDCEYYRNKYGRPHKKWGGDGSIGVCVEASSLVVQDGLLKFEDLGRRHDGIVASAFEAARSARFEYGQSGATA